MSNWLSTNFVTADCNEALCLPNPRTGIPPGQVGTPAGQCKGLKQAEEDFTYKDGDGVQAVVNCLTYNVENIPKFSACANDCNETNCSNLPRSLLIYNAADPFDTNEFVSPKEADLRAFDDCLNNGNCSGVPSNSPWGTPYTGDVNQDWILAQGSCIDPSDGVGPDGRSFADWQGKLLLSAREAENQLAKLIKRRDFLAARFKEMQDLKTLLDNAVYQFDLLIDAANVLIDARVAAEAGSKKQPSLTSFAIYGWQTTPPPGTTIGLWHIVRVDGRVPGRCDNNCGKDGKVEPDLPWIKTYTKIIGIRRCFSMGDAFDKYGGCDSTGEYDEMDKCFVGGKVKAQVTRFDESKKQMSFPNGFNFWRFIFSNPFVLGGVPNTAKLDEDCLPFAGAPGAFMLNHPPSDSDDGGDPDGPYHRCWIRVNELLKHGVSSQACAEYYHHKQNPKGFNLKFAPCSGAF